MFDDEEINGEMEGFSDAADILAEAFNEHLQSQGDYNFLEAEELVELLKTYVSSRELSNHMTNDFTRGLLIGRVLATVESVYNAQTSSEDEEET